ncbi:signal transduction histidine kinase [Saccharopolyspora dendranthemae]|uniref:histidine kinase n=1 Tax=Saccharopolyspora dendranthemae TaxID=1181886 RepID=A0A561VAY9_9PSEU|nr:signal transduction histidine kinase [Saccharopolyspora dendranthemae]
MRRRWVPGARAYREPVLNSWRPDHRLALDGVAAALVLFLGLGSSLSALRGSAPWLWITTLIVLIGLAGVLALRRIRPLPALSAASALMLVLVALPDLPGGVPPVLLPFTAIYPVLLYSVIAYTDRWVLPVACGLLGSALVVARMVVSFPGGWVPALVLGAVAVATVLSAWALGRYRRIRVSYVRALEESAHRAEQLRQEQVRAAIAAERRLIAREIHDVAAHSLAVVLAQADTARMVFDRDPERAREMLSTALNVGRDAMQEMRGMLGVLRSGDDPVSSHEDRDLDSLIGSFRQAGADVELRSSGTRHDLSTADRHAVYRVVQESVTNALKHVGPQVTCRISLDWEPHRLTVAVTDDGPGTADDLTERGGYGLVGMAERMRQIGGGFVVRSEPGAGTTVRAEFELGER